MDAAMQERRRERRAFFARLRARTAGAAEGPVTESERAAHAWAMSNSRALVAAMRNARVAAASAEASRVASELARLPHEGSLRARRLAALARIDRIL